MVFVVAEQALNSRQLVSLLYMGLRRPLEIHTTPLLLLHFGHLANSFDNL